MRGHDRRGALIYITDRSPRPSQIALARAVGASMLTAAQLGRDQLKHDPSLIFDVDLRQIDTVRRLKSALSRGGQACRIFIVDDSIRVATVHANVLGADAVLSDPVGPDDIHAVIRKHFGITQLDKRGIEVMKSIDTGVDAIDSGFMAIAGNLDFDSLGATSASDQIANAIGDVGVEEWLATVKGYHVGTFQHCMLVTGVVSGFASRAGMSRRDVTQLTLAGLLHDIGKAAVPVEILDKPGVLTEEELAIVRLHPVTGHDYLTARSTVAASSLLSVRHHHEYLDGSGYPDGLMGGQIDDITRIITICDIYAALIERRSYKEPKTPAQAMIILNAMAQSGKVEGSLVRELGRIMLDRQSA